MSSNRRFVRSASLATAILVTLLAGSKVSHAQVKGKGAKQGIAARTSAYRGGMSGYTGHGNRNAMGNQNNGMVVQNLHSALMVLAQAQHDYQGHRVKAMHEIGNAIRHLEPQAARNGATNPATQYVSNRGNGSNGGAATKSNVSQTTSDQHLRTAMQGLNEIGTHLTKNGSTQNHARAITSIQKAMQELNVALTVR